SIAYAYRHQGRVTPLNRFIDTYEHRDLLANGIMLTRPRARLLIEKLLGRLGCCAGGDCVPTDKTATAGVDLVQLDNLSGAMGNGNGNGSGTGNGLNQIAGEFFARALAEDLAAADVFRITITSFLDAYNFDVRRVMKCCTHHVLPSGHVIPFCAYNVLYRDGHVPLPALKATRAALGPT